MGHRRTKQPSDIKWRPVEHSEKTQNKVIEAVIEVVANWQSEHPNTPVNIASYVRQYNVLYQRLNAR
jgi:hypothetical protein